jgi:CRP/FNR family transcriptional regulator, nitrogen oxide reductase regulator
LARLACSRGTSCKSIDHWCRASNSSAACPPKRSTTCSRRRPAAATADETVFEQGSAATHFFVLLHGRLRVSQVTADGQQIVVRMVSPGDIFGIAKALGRTDYPGTSTAVKDSIVLVWPMSAWDQMMAEHPELAVNAMRTMAGRLQEAQVRMRELATEAVERRVAHAVLRLASQAGKREAGGVRIDFPLSKQDIAEMTGTTLHTVSRILTAWEAEGLVEGGRQKLLVREAHELVLIADGLKPGRL